MFESGNQIVEVEQFSNKIRFWESQFGCCFQFRREGGGYLWGGGKFSKTENTSVVQQCDLSLAGYQRSISARVLSLDAFG